MKKYITKFLNWINEILSSDGRISSKRIVGVLFALFVVGWGSYYVVKMQNKGKESPTTVTLIEFIGGSSITLLAAGTAAEALKNRKKDE